MHNKVMISLAKPSFPTQNVFVLSLSVIHHYAYNAPTHIMPLRISYHYAYVTTHIMPPRIQTLLICNYVRHLASQRAQQNVGSSTCISPLNFRDQCFKWNDLNKNVACYASNNLGPVLTDDTCFRDCGSGLLTVGDPHGRWDVLMTRCVF